MVNTGPAKKINMATIAGGEIIAKILKAEGVEKVFGIIDGTYFGFYGSLGKHGIELITPRHEATAAHMAGAYARLTGKLGVCIASNGPGVANILAGVAVENAEGNNVLLITSSRRRGIGNPDRGGTYQYLNHVAVIKPMSKWAGRVDAPERISELMRRALRICHKGRAGVVHLDVPEDIMNGKTASVPVWKPEQYRHVRPINPTNQEVKRAAAMLLKAQFPIIHAGSGVIHAQAYDELAEVAELLHAPVTTSWAARGVFPETSPLAWSMVYVQACTKLRNSADLVLCLGSNLGETDWWGKPPYWKSPSEQKMIQVDIDEESLGMNKPADLPVFADVKVFLEKLLKYLRAYHKEIHTEERGKLVAELAKMKDKDREKLDEKLNDLSVPMSTAHVGAVCRELFDDDDIVVFDGGNSAVWGNFYHQIRVPNTFLSTPHFGMLGAGLGQALGAAVAHPNNWIYCIIGDGAFGFHPQEVETAVRNKLKVIFLVCCDKQWGMVKINQQFAMKPLKTMIKKTLSPKETINTDLGEIAFDDMARSMGAYGERVSDPKGLKPALLRCMDSGKPAVIHVDVDPVKHLWAPGLVHFKKMHQEPGG